MTTNILVTGGAGYVGSHTCQRLSQVGFQPVCVDNLYRGHRWAVKWGPLIVGDVRDERFLENVFLQYRPAAVCHFGALTFVGESVTTPEIYYHNNVLGTLTLLAVMRKHGHPPLIFSSSAATYGIPASLPIREDVPQKPVNPYGWTKLIVERILSDYEQAYGLRHAIFRYFNAAGADPGGELGEWHEPESHLIPLVIQTALGQRPFLEIFGQDYDTPDGSAVRDYIHVSDLAAAHVKALETLLNGSPSLALNLGTGRGHSVREVIRAVETVGQRPVRIKNAPRRPGDPPVLVADAGLAGRVLSWTPAFPDLESIVRTAWDWHSQHSAKVIS